MLLNILKNNKLARITVIITSFTIAVCLIVGFMIVKLSDKIQGTKVSIKQNSVNVEKIEKLLADYQKLEFKDIQSETQIKKQILKKDDVVELIELMEKTALQNKILPYSNIEGGNDLSNLSDNITYNIRFQSNETKMFDYIKSLEDLAYINEFLDFQSSFSFNNNDILELEDEDEIQAKIDAKKTESDQSYSMRLKILLK